MTADNWHPFFYGGDLKMVYFVLQATVYALIISNDMGLPYLYYQFRRYGTRYGNDG
jgi:hypothetical protein